MEVRADLDGTITGVDDANGGGGAAGVELDLSRRGAELARDHAIGSWSVTSFRPSGKVASTWTSSIISGTPSMTSPRLRTWRPAFIRSETVRPSRAPSITQHESKATASGWLSKTPRARRSRAISPAMLSSSLSWSAGVRCIGFGVEAAGAPVAVSRHQVVHTLALEATDVACSDDPSAGA